jgi:hypothetical protein
MTDQGTLLGFDLAREGADRAIVHADGVVPNWSEQARGFMAGYIAQHACFTSEEVWVAAEAAGIPKPPDRRSWGGIINGFSRRGLIKRIGESYSKIPELHGNHIAVYQVL